MLLKKNCPGQKTNANVKLTTVAKEKTHHKTQLTVNKQGLIVHKSPHAKGSTHNYALHSNLS
jgi:hypothetical protein